MITNNGILVKGRRSEHSGSGSSGSPFSGAVGRVNYPTTIRNATPLKRSPEASWPKFYQSQPITPTRLWTPRGNNGFEQSYRGRAYSCPAANQANVRAVTPPPTQKDEGWVTVSTMNMSPFMVLRIKALIELASIPTYSVNQQVS